CPEFAVEADVGPAAGLAVKKRSARNFDVQHLFQAKRLGAKLDLIAMVGFRASALVLDGKWTHLSGIVRMEFDDIRLARKSQPKTAQMQPPANADSFPRLIMSRVRPLMQLASFGGESVFHPLLLQMDQRPLPLAKSQM